MPPSSNVLAPQSFRRETLKDGNQYNVQTHSKAKWLRLSPAGFGSAKRLSGGKFLLQLRK